MKDYAKAQRARCAAEQRLKELYPDDWKRFHVEERTKLGLEEEVWTNGKRNKPCAMCGAPKDRGKSGAKYCSACVPIAAERKRLAKLEYNRRPEVKARNSAWARENRPVRPRKIRPPKPKPVVAPSDVRSAWRAAKPNSIIRRKYPTVEALNRAYAAGELPRVA